MLKISKDAKDCLIEFPWKSQNTEGGILRNLYNPQHPNSKKNFNYMKNRIKIIATISASLLFSTALMAQETAKAAVKTGGAQEFTNIIQLVFFGTIAALALTSAWLALKTINMYRDMLTVANAKLEGRELPIKEPTPSVLEGFLSKMWYQLTGTGAVAIEREKDIMIDHPHDGIYELDNQLPPWWVNMFYATIIFAIGYFAYYHYFDAGKLQLDQYKDEMRVGEIQKIVAADRQANAVNENTVATLTDQKSLVAGQEIFIGKCAACHGQKGEGTVGPNMTDDYWLHGGSIKNIFHTITNGVPDKGMISWSSQLRPSEIQQVASYLLTLRGTNPPNPKAPQGDKYVPEK
jgi:cytochrome c oxidase cbb3-type subunit III